MRYIAHRGLFNGPDKTLENHPDQISRALARGFDVEVDVNLLDGYWWLGHDRPDYEVDEKFLEQPGLWIHAKNLDALRKLTDTSLNYFWHQEDNFTLTSRGYIWTYPGNELTDQSVMVMPEYVDVSLNNTLEVDCYGICSDYVLKISDTHCQRPKLK